MGWRVLLCLAWCSQLPGQYAPSTSSVEPHADLRRLATEKRDGWLQLHKEMEASLRSGTACDQKAPMLINAARKSAAAAFEATAQYYKAVAVDANETGRSIETMKSDRAVIRKEVAALILREKGELAVIESRVGAFAGRSSEATRPLRELREGLMDRIKQLELVTANLDELETFEDSRRETQRAQASTIERTSANVGTLAIAWDFYYLSQESRLKGACVSAPTVIEMPTPPKKEQERN